MGFVVQCLGGIYSQWFQWKTATIVPWLRGRYGSERNHGINARMLSVLEPCSASEAPRMLDGDGRDRFTSCGVGCANFGVIAWIHGVLCEWQRTWRFHNAASFRSLTTDCHDSRLVFQQVQTLPQSWWEWDLARDWTFGNSSPYEALPKSCCFAVR